MQNSTRLLLVSAGLLTLAGTAHAAIAWNEYQISGFFSQGYIHTSANDYPTTGSSGGDFDFREYGVSASRRFGANWRVGAQVFGQELGTYGNDDLVLDWAIVDYNVRQEFGLRAGRVKMPRGLYNEALDLDMARAQVLMPQSVYDVRLRDFNGSFDGVMAYGNIGIGGLGSVDYRVFYGEKSMSIESGASDYFNNDVPFPNVDIGMDSTMGATWFWNTPVEGLRAGYSFGRFENFTALRHVHIPGVFDMVVYKTAPQYDRHLLSLEYLRGDWTFAAEVGRESATYEIGIPGGAPYAFLHFQNEYGYASAARRINAWLEVGGYYSHSLERSYLPSFPLPDLRQEDYAISFRLDVNEHLVLKLEQHYIHGAGKVFDTPSHPQPFANRDTSWTMTAAKATLFF